MSTLKLNKWKEYLKIFIPFKHLTQKERNFSTLLVILGFFVLWESSGASFIPSPIDVVKSLPVLISKKSLFSNFFISVIFCMKVILYSVIISYIFSLFSIIPAFRVFCTFLRKFRFLPSAGLSFLFMKITPDIDSQKLWMMIFGVTTWLIDSYIGVALSITDDDLAYAKSLRLSRTQMIKELFIYGKSKEIFEATIANFAMAWMLLAAIENISKSSGGIGVVLSESNKYFKLEEVYAIQFLILFTGIFIDYILNIVKLWMIPYSRKS